MYAFTRAGDTDAQRLAFESGAIWAADSSRAPPCELDAAILFAPVGALLPEALRHTAKGGIVVCAGIHMSDIQSFPYSILWGERNVRSIANLTRQDGAAFFDIAARAKIRTRVVTYPLAEARAALDDLRAGHVNGAAVLTMG